MKKLPLIVSFYTRNTPYEKEVENLISSCKSYEVEHYVEGISSFGSWELNCAYKPFFLLQKLQEFERPLLWVDADAVFKQKLEWIQQFDLDISTRIQDNLSENHHSKVITGTVFVNHTPSAKKILTQWCKKCTETLLNEDRAEEFWEQCALRDVLKDFIEIAKTGPLPLTHTKICDFDKNLIDTPVIEHYQASRRHKFYVDFAR